VSDADPSVSVPGAGPKGIGKGPTHRHSNGRVSAASASRVGAANPNQQRVGRRPVDQPEGNLQRPLLSPAADPCRTERRQQLVDGSECQGHLRLDGYGRTICMSPAFSTA
jgi:hypothetical protein